MFSVFLFVARIPQASAAGIQVTVDGRSVHFPGNAPYVDENGRTMIPLRSVAEALGCETVWDSDRQSAAVRKTLTIYSVKKMNEAQIAQAENVGQPRICRSIRRARKILEKYFSEGGKAGDKNG